VIGFAHIEALWGLLAVPVLVLVYAFDGQVRRRALERVGHLPQIQRMTASVSTARRRWRAILNVLAVALLVVALASPEGGGSAHLAPRRGLDLVVALDFSRSMLASDVYPTRLDRAKRELDQLIDGLKGDRVGLVAFAGVTLSYPLTNDYQAAKLFWRDLGPDDIPVGGTNLAGALSGALDLLDRARDRRPRAGGKQPA
jgi:Ca-activated chloride channel family protein